jgi:hypothetical protein
VVGNTDEEPDLEIRLSIPTLPHGSQPGEYVHYSKSEKDILNESAATDLLKRSVILILLQAGFESMFSHKH